jgi:DNA-binding winged helix-turn-helix (wHTH) protein
MTMRSAFGKFVLDDGEKRLFKDGRPLHLTPKAYGLLRFLVAQGTRAVSKSELLQELWPATFVSDPALTTVVKELRRALGDDARAPRYIRAVRGFGYAFCAEAVAAPGAPPAAAGKAARWEFRLIWQRREIALAPGTNLLGRTPEALLWVEHPSVSRRHAIIHVEGGRATIEDCGSKNGTFVSRRRVEGRRELRAGDELWLGSARLVFTRCDGAERTATDAKPRSARF